MDTEYKKQLMRREIAKAVTMISWMNAKEFLYFISNLTFLGCCAYDDAKFIYATNLKLLDDYLKDEASFDEKVSFVTKEIEEL